MNFGAWDVEFDEADSRLKVVNPFPRVEPMGEVTVGTGVANCTAAKVMV